MERYMESIVLELIILPFCDQVYSLVLSTVSCSVGRWLITDDSCLWRSLRLSLSLRFKPAPDCKLCYSINSKLQRTLHPELMYQSYLCVRHIHYHLIASADIWENFVRWVMFSRSIIFVETEERQWNWILTWCVYVDIVCFIAIASHWFKHVAPTFRKPNQ